MYLNNDKIMFGTNFMFYLTCSEGHYYFVEFLFQGCVRVEGVCVCVCVVEVRSAPETLACSAAETGFGSVADPSLPRRRLKTLRNCVCFCIP